MLTIRLRRHGARKNPHYRVVVTERSAKRDGPFIEILGHYHPRKRPAEIVFDMERTESWLGKGAIMSDTVRTLYQRVKSGRAEVAEQEPEKKVAPAPAPEAPAAEEEGAEPAAAEAETVEAEEVETAPAADAEETVEAAPAVDETQAVEETEVVEEAASAEEAEPAEEAVQADQAEAPGAAEEVEEDDDGDKE